MSLESDLDTACCNQTEPIMCTIDAPRIGPHLETLERLRGGIRSIDRTEAGLELRFSPSPEASADVERFVSEESQCCRFWAFTVTADEEIVLRWDGPPETQDFMEVLLGYLRGEVPVGRLFSPIQPNPILRTGAER